MQRRVWVLIFFTWTVAGLPWRAHAEDCTQRERAFLSDVAPIFAKYCTVCHGGSEPKGDLALDSYKDEATAEKDRDTWERVLDMLTLDAMPPKGKPRPTAQEVEEITKWIDGALAKTDCGGQKHPGRVTMRRLNRAEYNNTIRDLLGVDFRPADDFPSDDVGYGFDNIGDVLSISPILMEKYVAAAEQIVERAIATDVAVRVPLQRVEANELRGGVRHGRQVAVSHNEAYAVLEFPEDGEYAVRVKAFVDPAGDQPVQMIVRLDEQEILTTPVQEPRKSARVYETHFNAAEGIRRVVFANAQGGSPSDSAGDNKQQAPLLVLEYVELRGPIDLPASHRRLITCEPGPERSVAQCARKILADFASRAFRRPATPDEVDRLVRLVELTQRQGDSFERGIQLAVEAVLASPHFLFRVELDPEPNDPAAIRPLSDYELATRLSYFLWSTMPDDELFDLAGRGELRSEGVLDAQVRRMLRDPKSQALVQNFAGQWLQLRDVAKVTPDAELFPTFDSELREAIERETELLFETVMHEDRSVQEFLDADYTFVNERLARHYGISGVTGSEFRRVSLEGTTRRGVLTHASILTLTSNPTRTSPVKRGKWILDNILGTPPPPPLPDVPELDNSKEAMLQGSLRERMEQHRSKPMCASCHARMDPIGFAFENFDAIGAWRISDGKFPIDASGTLPGGKTFDGPKELVALLKTGRRQLFCRSIADKMLTYALGRGLETFDRCSVNQIVETLEKNEYRFSSLILAVVHSDPFLYRGAKETSDGGIRNP